MLTAAEKTALTHLFTALPNIGLVTTDVGGKWYVSPIRTFADLVPSVLSGLTDNDLLTLIKLAQRSHWQHWSVRHSLAGCPSRPRPGSGLTNPARTARRRRASPAAIVISAPSNSADASPRLQQPLLGADRRRGDRYAELRGGQQPDRVRLAGERGQRGGRRPRPRRAAAPAR